MYLPGRHSPIPAAALGSVEVCSGVCDQHCCHLFPVAELRAAREGGWGADVGQEHCREKTGIFTQNAAH